ncbi:MAG: SHOCT domain-containing protein [Janthinobacterium lividum]
MFRRYLALVAPLVLTGALAGCATAEIVPIGTDSYMIAQTSAGGVFKAMASLKTEVMQRANAFAESKGKVAIPIAAKESPAYPGHMPSFEYQFRLVNKDDPRAIGGGLVPRADVVVENHIQTQPAAKQNVAGARKDIYVELTKLDDLRKKGILTDAEFEAQKRRLLSDE